MSDEEAQSFPVKPVDPPADKPKPKRRGQVRRKKHPRMEKVRMLAIKKRILNLRPNLLSKILKKKKIKIPPAQNREGLGSLLGN